MFASTTAVTSLTRVQIMTSKFNLSLVYVAKGKGPCCLHSSFIWFISSYSCLSFPCGWSEWPSRKSAPHASVPPTGLPSCPLQTIIAGPMPFGDYIFFLSKSSISYAFNIPLYLPQDMIAWPIPLFFIQMIIVQQRTRPDWRRYVGVAFIAYS